MSDPPFKAIAGWRGDSLCCPQAFGGDIFSGCSMGCHWFCFCRELEAKVGKDPTRVRCAEPDEFRRLFDRAFGCDGPSDDWLVKCLRWGLPFNMGSKSEPFANPDEPRVRKILELFLEYQVPVIFETKSVYAGLAQYLEILKLLRCAVIVSIMGGPDTLNYQLEPGVPCASTRWQFVEQLNRLGVWCGVRWEPILPGINSKDAYLKKYAEDAKRFGAKHVSIYNYRSSDYDAAKVAFESRGYNYLKMLQGNLDDNWRPVGEKLIEYLRDARVPVSTPDFVNFPFHSDCISCCGTDKLFPPYQFTFQYACHLIKTRGRVSWDDMEAVDFRHPEAYELMRNNWNGKDLSPTGEGRGGIWTLRDSPWIRVEDTDSRGFNVYTARSLPKQRRGFGL